MDTPNGRSTACHMRQMCEVCQGYTEPFATYRCSCPCHEVTEEVDR